MEGEVVAVAPDRRTRWQVVLGLLLLGIAVLVVWKLPPWLVEKAEKSADECFADEQRDPAECKPGASLGFASVFPHAKQRAREIRAATDERAAYLAFWRAVDRPRDQAARTAAARAYVDARGPTDEVINGLSSAGAFDVLATLDGGTSRTAHLPAFAAIELGQPALAKQRLPATVDDHEGASRAAALACLLGDRERAVGLLAHVHRLGARDTSTRDTKARFVALHCGLPRAKLPFDPAAVSGTYSELAAVAQAFDPAFQANRRTSLGTILSREATIFRGAETGAFALALGSEAPLEPLRQLEILGRRARDFDDGFATTAWSALTSERDAYTDYVPPAWLEAAGERLLHGAATAPKKLPDDIMLYGVEGVLPGAYLRAAALFMYEHAIGYRIRRGDRAGARERLVALRALDPTRHSLVPLLLAAGDGDGALAMIAAVDKAKLTDPQREALAINHALALMTKGDFAGAHAAIRERKSLEAQWLILASALAANMRTDELRLLAPSESYLDGAARWHSRIVDKRFEDEGVRTDGDAVLPAMIFVVAHAAQVAGLNPELALDRMFEGKLPSRRFAFARAEAARWRKATDVAQAHQARGEVIEKLMVDDRAAVLAAIAELM